MAAGSGVVQLAGRLGGYGNYLRINHQNGYGTAYGHLSRLAPRHPFRQPCASGPDRRL